MTNILITGGCGFIGLNLVNYLLGEGIFNLRILDDLSVGRKENLRAIASSHYKVIKEISPVFALDSLFPGTIQLLIGDIRERKVCLRATEGIDTVIHLAAHADVVSSVNDPYFDFEVNVLGTLHLLQAGVENVVDKFIFASSNALMGDQTPPIKEELAPNPLSPYGSSKLSGEGYCSSFYSSYGLKTVILRFSNVYGNYSLYKNSVIAKFIKDALIKRALTIYGNGSQTRDFIHVEDLCAAIFLILNRREESCPSGSKKIWGEKINLGSGQESRIIDLANIVKPLFRDEIEIIFAPPRAGEIEKNYSEITKAKKILNFMPKIALETGVSKVYDWFLKQGIERIKNAEILSGSD